MSTYNLSDNVQDDFTFQVRDKKYVMRYPRTEEVENIQKLNEQLEQAQNLKDENEVERLSKRLENFLYDFITPDGHQVPIQEALSKENIRVMKNFNTMIKTELAI